ncbi:MAG TPA: hypothetical protein VGM82_12895 [Gemmatimonadaceae bacterium]
MPTRTLLIPRTWDIDDRYVQQHLLTMELTTFESAPASGREHEASASVYRCRTRGTDQTDRYGAECDIYEIDGRSGRARAGDQRLRRSHSTTLRRGIGTLAGHRA